MAGEKRYSTIYKIVTTKNKQLIEGDKAIGPELLMLLIYEVEQYILNYCRIPFVPKELMYTWANITSDAALYEMEKNAPPESSGTISPDDMTSVHVGDTSVTLGNRSNTASLRSKILGGHSFKLDDVVFNYRSQLNEFRRLW